MNSISQKENFWEDSVNASKILSTKSKLENTLKTFLTLEKDLIELKEFYQSFKNEHDQNVKKEITEIVKALKKKVKDVRVQTLLSVKLMIMIVSGNSCWSWWNRKSRLG